MYLVYQYQVLKKAIWSKLRNTYFYKPSSFPPTHKHWQDQGPQSQGCFPVRSQWVFVRWRWRLPSATSWLSGPPSPRQHSVWRATLRGAPSPGRPPRHSYWTWSYCSGGPSYSVPKIYLFDIVWSLNKCLTTVWRTSCNNGILLILYIWSFSKKYKFFGSGSL